MNHPTDEDLDVKLPATTKKAQDVLLEDLVHTSIPSPYTPTDRTGVGEQLNVSQDLKNIHVFNDNTKMTSDENNEQEHPKMMEVQVGTQQKNPATKSKTTSKTTTKIVNLNHTKEFQECMDSYKIGNGYIHLTQLLHCIL